MTFYNRYLMDLDDPQSGDVRLCGGKAAMIHKMRARFGELFPGGFVATIHANGLSDSELSKELAPIKSAFGENARFAVRSSATVEDGVNLAFPGQFHSLLDVGYENLLTAIREVQISAAGENVFAYCRQNGIDPGIISMAVLIMRMAGEKGSVISGAIFTVDPETGCADNYISASKGYGDAEMSGQVTPEIAVCRGGSILRRKPRAPNTKYLLNEETILSLSGYATNVEKAMRGLSPGIRFADIEYVIDSGKIFFVQARPETAASLHPNSFRAVSADVGYRAIVSHAGYAASRGVASGAANYCHTIADADKMEGGGILLCRETSSSWEPFMRRCMGIVTAYGGPNCHTAVCAREMGIPCVTGVGDEAMETIRKQTGNHITVDATARIIYEGAVDEKHLIYRSSLPDYGDLDRIDEEQSFQDAAAVDQTRVDGEGRRWLKKPKDVTSPLLHEIHRQGNFFVTEMLGLPPVNDQVYEGVYWMSFSDAFGFRERLRIYTPEELNGLLDRWDNRMREYISLSENIGSTDQLPCWFRYFIEVNAFMNLSYPLFYVISGQFERVLADKKLPEPYFTRAHHSVLPGTPLSWAQEAIVDFIALLEKEPSDEEVCAYALRYRITPNNCIEFDAGLQIDELKRKIETGRGSIPIFFPSEEEEYFVNDPSFTLIHKNMRRVTRLKESSHHMKLYGQRLIIEKFDKTCIEESFCREKMYFAPVKYPYAPIRENLR